MDDTAPLLLYLDRDDGDGPVCLGSIGAFASVELAVKQNGEERAFVSLEARENVVYAVLVHDVGGDCDMGTFRPCTTRHSVTDLDAWLAAEPDQEDHERDI